MKRTKRVTDFLGKLAVSVVVAVAAFIPTLLFLAIKHFTNPVGFLQNLALTGLGIYFLGLFQAAILLGLIAFLVGLWREY